MSMSASRAGNHTINKKDREESQHLVTPGIDLGFGSASVRTENVTVRGGHIDNRAIGPQAKTLLTNSIVTDGDVSNNAIHYSGPQTPEILQNTLRQTRPQKRISQSSQTEEMVSDEDQFVLSSTTPFWVADKKETPCSSSSVANSSGHRITGGGSAVNIAFSGNPNVSGPLVILGERQPIISPISSTPHGFFEKTYSVSKAQSYWYSAGYAALPVLNEQNKEKLKKTLADIVKDNNFNLVKLTCFISYAKPLHEDDESGKKHAEWVEEFKLFLEELNYFKKIYLDICRNWSKDTKSKIHKEIEKSDIILIFYNKNYTINLNEAGHILEFEHRSIKEKLAKTKVFTILLERGLERTIGNQAIPVIDLFTKDPQPPLFGNVFKLIIDMIGIKFSYKVHKAFKAFNSLSYASQPIQENSASCCSKTLQVYSKDVSEETELLAHLDVDAVKEELKSTIIVRTTSEKTDLPKSLSAQVDIGGAEEKSKIITSIPLCKKSEINKSYDITEGFWVLSLARKINFGNVQHVFIVLEGINENRDFFVWYSDWTTSDNKFGSVNIDEVSCKEYERELLPEIKRNRLTDVTLTACSWSITRGKGLELKKNVETQQKRIETGEEKLPYEVLGNNSFIAYSSRTTGHNCMTWARDAINQLSVEEIHVPVHFFDWVATLPSRHIPDPRRNSCSFWTSLRSRVEIIPARLNVSTMIARQCAIL